MMTHLVRTIIEKLTSSLVLLSLILFIKICCCIAWSSRYGYEVLEVSEQSSGPAAVTSTSTVGNTAQLCSSILNSGTYFH